jgi:wyosine [tRNA(Phe)-imidazoG37] synthetase (radical SAM superfamily)
VIADLEQYLQTMPDYITLSGSGEPTLYSRIDELIAAIKRITDTPVTVLTNGSLFWQKDVRCQLSQADLVIPSLDAADETTFQRINRPHEQISFSRMFEGLVALRQELSSEFWLEIMVVDGDTANAAEMAKLADCADRIRPDRVQLNTVTRPPAEKQATGCSPQQLREFCSLFRTPVEVIADFRDIHQQPRFVGGRKEVLAMLQRRPSSVEDIARGLQMHRNEAVKHLEELLAEHAVETLTSGTKRFYRGFREADRKSSES